jgi:hypothetical protein
MLSFRFKEYHELVGNRGVGEVLWLGKSLRSAAGVEMAGMKIYFLLL